MAVNETRSMNNDLRLGANDGKFKNLTPDRGGEPEMEHVIERATVLQPQYNVQMTQRTTMDAHLEKGLGTR